MVWRYSEHGGHAYSPRLWSVFLDYARELDGTFATVASASVIRWANWYVFRHFPKDGGFTNGIHLGAGKSTLIKVLVDYQERMKNIQNTEEFPSPVAGSANAHAPTSGDVHLYADVRVFPNHFRLLSG